MAILAALVGFLIAVATVTFGNRIANRWLRYLALLAGICCALALMSVLTPNQEVASLAGEIFAGLIVVAYALKSIFFRKKKVPAS